MYSGYEDFRYTLKHKEGRCNFDFISPDMSSFPQITLSRNEPELRYDPEMYLQLACDKNIILYLRARATKQEAGPEVFILFFRKRRRERRKGTAPASQGN